MYVFVGKNFVNYEGDKEVMALRLSKSEKLATMLCQAIRRYVKAQKRERKNGLAVDNFREKSVTVTVEVDELENGNDSKK